MTSKCPASYSGSTKEWVRPLLVEIGPARHFSSQLPELVLTLVERVGAAGAEIVQAFVADLDEEKRLILSRAGFAEEIRLPHRLRVGGHRAELLVYSRHLNRHRFPAHPPSAYYGVAPAYLAETATDRSAVE